MSRNTERLPQLAILVSQSETPCGVDAFARRLAATAGARAITPVLNGDLAGLVRAIEGCEALVVNLPVVAWKKRIVEPALAIAAARLRRVKVILVLHEWSDLDWKRRASYLPLLPLVNSIVFSCPEIAGQFTASAILRLATAQRGVVPIPPNLARPDVVSATGHSAQIAEERSAGRLILGQFGSVYPKKRSTLVLDVAAELKRRGEDPFVVFAGSFVRGSDSLEDEFYRRVRDLRLQDHVMVTGFIQHEAELFGVLEAIDVFVYSFSEGLTSRRASVFASLTSGRPVVVNAPRDASTFDHHPTYRKLLSDGLLRLVSHQASIGEIASAVLEAKRLTLTAAPIDIAGAWQSALATFDSFAAA